MCCPNLSDQPEPDQQRHPLARLNLPFIVLIKLYQFTLSPLIGNQCRFQPTCSYYGLECFRTHHAFRACWLTTKRVLRCHPLGGHGPDPPPPYIPPHKDA